MLKKKEWPEPKELVIGNVVRVGQFSADVLLPEYPNKKGMIHISEAARKWIKDIREVLKEGQRIVAVVVAVEPQRNFISLSIKRVSSYQAEEKIKVFKREEKAQKILAAIAAKGKITIEQAYKEIGAVLENNFGEMFKGFQAIAENPEIIRSKGMLGKWTELVISVASEHFEKSEVEIKGLLELYCHLPNGVECIKKAFAEVPQEIELRYISAPVYSLVIKTKNIKAGEELLKKTADKIIASIKAQGGNGSFRLQGR